jgi:hypothetical protein
VRGDQCVEQYDQQHPGEQEGARVQQREPGPDARPPSPAGHRSRYPTPRVDQRRIAELAAQRHHRHPDHVGERVDVLVPRLLQQPLGRHDRALGPQQLLQHQELLVAQAERAAVAGRLAAGRVEPDAVPLQHRRGGPVRPAGQRANPGDQLGQGERLGQVVVGAQLQTGHPVGEVAGGGQHQDAGQRAAGDQPAADLVAVYAGQLPVEQQHVVVVDGEALQAARGRVQLGHRAARTVDLLGARPLRMPVGRVEPDELERLPHVPSGVGHTLLVLQHQHLLAGKLCEQAEYLLPVQAAFDLVVQQRRGSRIAAHVQEGQAGPDPLDRIAQHHEHPRVGRRGPQHRRRPEVVHVARRPLAGDSAGRPRKVPVVRLRIDIRACPNRDVRGFGQARAGERLALGGSGPAAAGGDEVVDRVEEPWLVSTRVPSMSQSTAAGITGFPGPGGG